MFWWGAAASACFVSSPFCLWKKFWLEPAAAAYSLWGLPASWCLREGMSDFLAKKLADLVWNSLLVAVPLIKSLKIFLVT